MIRKIKKIQKLGIFDEYTVAGDFNEFAKFNIFYGWNGCGKTTLSRVFSMLGKKQVDSFCNECAFEVMLEDKSTVKSSDLAAFGNSVYVFNQHFIEENIDWKTQGAKSIVVISEEKIHEREKYFELKNKVMPAKKTLRDASKSAYQQLEQERETFLTASAKGIKHSYQVIATADSRYMNYDKTKFRNFIESNKEKILSGDAILSDNELEELKKSLKPDFKPAVTLNMSSPDTETLSAQEHRIADLLKKEVVTQAIDRLKNNKDINSWVQQGLSIHEDHESSQCEFCTQSLPEGRVKQLKQHFSDEYSELIGHLSQGIDWVNQIKFSSELPDSVNIYDEFQNDFAKAVADVKDAETNLSKVLAHWKDKLHAKQANIFDINLALDVKIASFLTALTNAHDELKKVVDKHNLKASTFEDQLKAAKNRIELHYVASALSDNLYFNLLAKIDSEKEKFAALEKEVSNLETEKRKLESMLANVAKGADDFNAQLHKFLGRTDINLVYDLPAQA